MFPVKYSFGAVFITPSIPGKRVQQPKVIFFSMVLIDCQQPYKEKEAFLGVCIVLKTLFYVFNFIKYHTIYFEEIGIL